MRFALDILFLDEKGKVMEIIRSFPPWKRTRRVHGARYVLEVCEGTIEASGTEAGDVLSWQEPAGYSLSVLFNDRKGASARSGKDRSRV
jgi:uncharacterized membrane protein (UPF0127 family)